MRHFNELTDSEREAYREYFDKRDQNDIRIADKMFDLAVEIGARNAPKKIFKFKSFDALIPVLISQGYRPNSSDPSVWESSLMKNKPFKIEWFLNCGKEMSKFSEKEEEEYFLSSEWIETDEIYEK